MWASSEEEEMVFIRRYYYSSLKSETTYTVYVVLRKVAMFWLHSVSVLQDRVQCAAMLFYGTWQKKVSVLRPYVGT